MLLIRQSAKARDASTAACEATSERDEVELRLIHVSASEEMGLGAHAGLLLTL
jgi:hypothetical protein